MERPKFRVAEFDTLFGEGVDHSHGGGESCLVLVVSLYFDRGCEDFFGRDYVPSHDTIIPQRLFSTKPNFLFCLKSCYDILRSEVLLCYYESG